MSIVWDPDMVATLHAMRERRCSQAETASRIGVGRSTLGRFCQAHGIRPWRTRVAPPLTNAQRNARYWAKRALQAEIAQAVREQATAPLYDPPGLEW